MTAVTGKPCRLPYQDLAKHHETVTSKGAAGDARQDEVRCISRYEERTMVINPDHPAPSHHHDAADMTMFPGTEVGDPNWYPLSPKPAFKDLNHHIVDTSCVPSAGSVNANQRLDDSHGWMARKDRRNHWARQRDFHDHPGVSGQTINVGAAGRTSDVRRVDTPGGKTGSVGRWRSLTPDYHNRYAENLVGSSLPGIPNTSGFSGWTPPPTQDMAGLAPEKSTHGRTGWADHETGFGATRRMCAFDPRVSDLAPSTEMKDFCRYHKEENLDKAKWQKGYPKAGMLMSSASAGELRDMSILRSAAGLRMGNSISHLYGT